MASINPLTGRAIYYTRNYVKNHHASRRHPWAGTALPPSAHEHRRGPAPQGHEGALAFEEWDTSSLPDPDDGFTLGEPEQPEDRSLPTTHVRCIDGGYVHIYTKEAWIIRNSPVEVKKRREAALLKKRRVGMVGSVKRRRAWKKGAGVQRRRGADGKFA